MHLLFISLLLVVFAHSVSAQVVSPAPPLAGTSQAYLLKSHNQKAAARVLLIGGGVITAAAIGIAANGVTSYEDLGLAGLAVSVGTVAMLSSIPLFIAGGRNKARAGTAVSLGVDLYQGRQLPGALSPACPALSIRLSR